MGKVKNILTWISSNPLFVLSTFLISFIPLFPKIPLFDILPGYIVRVRVEDFLILLAAIIWLKDAFFSKKGTNEKINWNTSYFWLVSIYATIGIISIFLGTTLLKSIPAELLHIGKSSLHFFRYMEYFALFFFLYSSVNTKNQIIIILITIVSTLIGVIGYGYGQQYMHFPLYSTMNREYSKGEKLYLQENARPQSTFAGHYDLGAYLVIILPLIFALSLNLAKILPKTFKKIQVIGLQLLLHLIHASGAWMLITSGSKTALAAYLAGLLIVLYLNLSKLANFKQKLKWGIVSLISLFAITGVALTVFGPATETALISLAKTNPIANKIISKIPGINMEDSSIDSSRPDDLYGEGHEFKLETSKDELGNESQKLVAQQSSWSENALKYGISMGIRLDTLWPQAIKGLINNPLFGNGYATLSQFQEGQFSEADSTDNNFLRTLGETGIFGFISFYGLIIYILSVIYKNTKNSDPLIATINVGLTGSIIGLLINASYIDVFAASKVAFTFWALAGIGVRSGLIGKNAVKESSLKKSKNERTDLLATNLLASNLLDHFKKHKSFYLTFVILFFALHKNPYKENSLIRNFETSNAAIENVVTAKCYLESGSFSVCRNDGLKLKTNFNFPSLILTPFLAINSSPTTFYFLNLSISILMLLVVYKKISKLTTHNLTKFSALSSYIFFLYYINATLEPLTNKTLMLVFLVIPALTIIIAKLFAKQKKHFSIVLQYIFLVVLLISLINLDLINSIKTSFRNDQKAYKYWTIKRSNDHFDSKSLIDEKKSNYLISSINPYYFDFYKNDNYNLLPFSETQDYFQFAPKVWNELAMNQNKHDLIETYQNAINRGDRLFLSEFETSKNNDYLNSLAKIKNSFDLFYEVIDCDDQCNILKVGPIETRISQIPNSLNKLVLDPASLRSNYSFSIISNEFSTTDRTTPYNTKIMIDNLLSSNLISAKQSFTIFTGEILHTNEDYWKKYFNLNFADIIDRPIFHNSATSKKYYSFFTNSEYFIVLNLNEKSEIDENQKLFVFNALLEIEKLPKIKNVFIIDHNLDWKNPGDLLQNPGNSLQNPSFISLLEKKLKDFPDLNKFIISSQKLENSSNDENNTHYFSNQILSPSSTSYIQFNVDDNSTVTFENL